MATGVAKLSNYSKNNASSTKEKNLFSMISIKQTIKNYLFIFVVETIYKLLFHNINLYYYDPETTNKFLSKHFTKIFATYNYPGGKLKCFTEGIFLYNNKPVFIKFDYSADRLVVISFRWLVDFGNLSEKYEAVWDDENQHYYIDFVGEDDEPVEERSKHEKKKAPELFIEKDKQDIIDYIDKWIKHKEWYNKNNIPWKTGVLFYGAPGTGKTILTKYIAMYFDIPIFKINLADCTNNKFIQYWNSIKSRKGKYPCVVLIEDIDAIFNKRKNVSGNLNQEFNMKSSSCSSASSKLTFDTFINTLDGIENSDGILTIITTNDLSKIDSALANFDENGLVSRPGRIDRIVEFKHMNFINRKKMADKFLSEMSEEERISLCEEYKEVTPAQFQNICITTAFEKIVTKKI